MPTHITFYTGSGLVSCQEETKLSTTKMEMGAITPRAILSCSRVPKVPIEIAKGGLKPFGFDAGIAIDSSFEKRASIVIQMAIALDAAWEPSLAVTRG